MKMKLTKILDQATPEELDEISTFLQASEVPPECLRSIKKRVYAKAGIARHLTGRRWFVCAIAAASLCLVVGVAFAAGRFADPFVPPVQTEESEQTEQPGKELPKALSIQDLLARGDFAGIVWGAGTPEDNMPTPDDPQGGNGDAHPLEHVMWNGIALSSELYAKVADADCDAIIAITAENLVPNNDALEDFVYNGKTYAEYFEPWVQSNDAVKRMQKFCKLATRYEKWNQGEDAFWAKLHEDIENSEQLVAQYFDGERFLIDQIREEIDALQTVRDQYKDAWHECYNAYVAQQTPIELLFLVEHGYYVVENCGRYAVFINTQDMPKFAEDIVAVYGEQAVSQARIRFATPEELGVEGVEPVPGGVAEGEPEA
ncbi:MAG: hypothetical protein IJW70_04430 [Clostridia bacterium]|nr:hypothetical protein [Clostridia bacterium]